MEYFITGKREADGAISHVRIYEEDNFWTVDKVICHIEKGDVFYTFRKEGDKWIRGDRIHKVLEKYIRTDGNKSSLDNLENLPDV